MTAILERALPVEGLHCGECGDTFPRSGAKRFCSRECAAASRSRARFTPEKFWERVKKASPGDCWEWTGARTSGGYGNLRRPHGTFDYSHRVAYELTIGPIPEGLQIDHLCRNRICCNPRHLEPVPQRINVVRGMSPYGVRTTCKHGHDITDPQNVYTAPRGDNRCRTCASIQESKRPQRSASSRRAGSTTA